MKEGRIREDRFIYMVLEYGEIDLAHMVSQKWREANKSTMCIAENWLRFYWMVTNTRLFDLILFLD
jgi:serine/threonine-protein kinase TTK/MPS1